MNEPDGPAVTALELTQARKLEGTQSLRTPGDRDPGPKRYKGEHADRRWCRMRERSPHLGIAARARSATIATAAIAAAVTLLVSLLPFVDFAYRSRSMHVAIETAAVLIALLASYLVFERFRRDARLSNLLLASALFLFAFTNLFFSAMPAMLDARPGAFSTWAPVAGRTLGATALAVSAFAPGTCLRRPRAAASGLLMGCAAVLAAIAFFAAVFSERLPTAVDPDLSPESSNAVLVGDPAVLVVQVLVMALFAAAAVGFVRRAERGGDELMGWFAIGSTLAAFSRLNYFLFPSLYSEWVYTGDLFRLAFYLMLLFGAAHEIDSYHRRLGEATVLEDRRRMARDLHDGLAQELAFIAGQVKRLARGSSAHPSVLDQVAGAAERALDESRGAISALTRPTDEPVDVELAQAAEEVAERVGVKVRFDLLDSVEVVSPTRMALRRVVREAVTNAARHGGASTVSISLSGHGGLGLRIADDGRGFDPTAAVAEGGSSGGFGLISMRERVEALGGQLRIFSSPGSGTEIEVVLP